MADRSVADTGATNSKAASSAAVRNPSISICNAGIAPSLISQGWPTKRTIVCGQEAALKGEGNVCEKAVNRRSIAHSRIVNATCTMATTATAMENGNASRLQRAAGKLAAAEPAQARCACHRRLVARRCSELDVQLRNGLARRALGRSLDRRRARVHAVQLAGKPYPASRLKVRRARAISALGLLRGRVFLDPPSVSVVSHASLGVFLGFPVSMFR